jgi:hypothetical protein
MSLKTGRKSVSDFKRLVLNNKHSSTAEKRFTGSYCRRKIDFFHFSRQISALSLLELAFLSFLRKTVLISLSSLSKGVLTMSSKVAKRFGPTVIAAVAQYSNENQSTNQHQSQADAVVRTIFAPSHEFKQPSQHHDSLTQATYVSPP